MTRTRLILTCTFWIVPVLLLVITWPLSYWRGMVFTRTVIFSKTSFRTDRLAVSNGLLIWGTSQWDQTYNDVGAAPGSVLHGFRFAKPTKPANWNYFKPREVMNSVGWDPSFRANSREFLGVQLYHASATRNWGRDLIVPCLAPTLIFVPIALLRIQKACLNRIRQSGGLCKRCGYDLRASVDRCPECGDTFEPSEVAKAVVG
jgi:hypothetical protein